MASELRYFPNDTGTLRLDLDSRGQLLKSLSTIVQGSPPHKPWTDSFKPTPQGLWTGPTSLAYLFFWLSTTHPGLEVEGRLAHEWCLAYLGCGSGDLPNALGLNGWGIKNEYLAFHTVKAIATQDSSAVDALVGAISTDFQCSDVDNEHLSGRAGTLALLRIVRHFMPSEEARLNECMQPLIQHVLKQIPWRFHGHNYIGAAHGVIGILTQLVLCEPSLGKDPIVTAQISEQLDLQAEDGHWFITDDPKLGENDLVHYCHGSPGFVLSLLKMRPFVDSELQARIDVAVEKGRKEIWEKGLLRKEPNLCHGITGNMLALEWPQRRHFMSYATMEEITAGKASGRFIPGDDKYGLLWGEAGRAWGWMMMDSETDLGYPSYTDV